MAAENQVDVSIKLTADNKGGKDVERQLDRIEQKSKSSTKGIADSFAKATANASKYQGVVSRLANLSIFTGGIASVISIWDKITDSAKKAKEASAEFEREQSKAADTKRIDALNEAYRKLGEQIANATKERQRANELEKQKGSELIDIVSLI